MSMVSGTINVWDGAAWVPTVSSGGGGGGDPYIEAVMADTPVTFWPLDETSGTALLDASGNGFDGTYVNGVTLTPNGPGGHRGAIFASASDQYAQITHDAAFQPVHFTCEAWVKSSMSVWGCIASQPASPYGFNLFLTNSTGTFRGTADTGTPHEVYSSATINDGEWHHVAVTYDGAHIKLYVDGVPDTSEVETGTVLYTNSSFFLIGAQLDAHDYNFDGTIALVAIYDVALDAAAIAAHVTAMGTP